jgi:glutamate/tyrosine decarboxylase-like PLP-dependent enzyme
LTNHRSSPAELSPDAFRRLGHRVVDQVADFLASLPSRPVSPDTTPARIREILGADASLPTTGEDPATLFDEIAKTLFDHSTFNGHPRFFGYITSSAAPVGALADLLAATVNPNCGAWSLSPVATEIERQAVRWIAELIGFPASCGGILVSGGNMANIVCAMAASRAVAGWDIRQSGVSAGPRLTLYTSTETHTWIQKFADMCGLGLDCVRWVPVDETLAMNTEALRAMLDDDVRAGARPFMVVGTGGSVSTGAIDPLAELAAICRERGLWFHVDGAYGAPAAVLPDAPPSLRALSLADSVAIDPHKWLYAPLEAGCVLVRDPEALTRAFGFHPPYYAFEGDAADPPTNFHEHGPQNSRGFRALKVWMTMRQVGRAGYEGMIADDIGLARLLFDLARNTNEIEALTHGLSITTFRYRPRDVAATDAASLNALNAELLQRLQRAGRVFLSNAVVDGKFALRACVVNFRSTEDDMRAVIDEVRRVGGELTS